MEGNMKAKENFTKVLIHVILILVSITMLVPFIWMILTAFKTVTEATSVDPFVIFPKVWRTDSFKEVIRNMNFFVLYKNTLLMIFFRVLCAVLTATMAGYAFGRLHFKGRDFCFSLVLLQMMVPAQIFISPQYIMVSKMGMLNTIFGLVFPGMVTAFGTFLLRQGYMGLPNDLEEAARLDGCNIGQTFLYIMAPLTRSSMVALGIFTAVFAFKDLMWPMIVNTDKDMLVLSSALAKMQGQYGKLGAAYSPICRSARWDGWGKAHENGDWVCRRPLCLAGVQRSQPPCHGSQTAPIKIALQERCFPQGKIHSARQCQSCMQVGRSFHARLFPRRSIGSGGLRILAVHGTARECQSRSRRPFWCSRCIRRNTRYTAFRRNGRQQKR